MRIPGSARGAQAATLSARSIWTWSSPTSAATCARWGTRGRCAYAAACRRTSSRKAKMSLEGPVPLATLASGDCSALRSVA